MIWLLFMLILFFVIVRGVTKRGLPSGRLRSPIEPAPKRPELPATETAKPAIRDGKATVETLMDDFAEGRISVEEYEQRLDTIYKKRQS